MAIDVLSREGCMPIIVGDENDMADIWSVDSADGEAEACIVLEGRDNRLVSVELSPNASKNIKSQQLAVLVALKPNDDIAYAHIYQIGGDGPLRKLDTNELKMIAETLV